MRLRSNFATALLSITISLTALAVSTSASAAAWPVGQESVSCRYSYESADKKHSIEMKSSYSLKQTYLDFKVGSFDVLVQSAEGYVQDDGMDFVSSFAIEVSCFTPEGEFQAPYLEIWTKKIPLTTGEFGFTEDVQLEHCSNGSKLRLSCQLDAN